MPTASTAPTQPVLPAARAGRTRRSGPFGRLLSAEWRLVLREPAYLFWTVGLPVALLAIFGLVPSTADPVARGSDVRVIDAYLPILVVLALGMNAFNALPATLTGYREKGILRRLATTPVPAGRLLAAQLALHAAIGAVTVVALTAVAHLAFEVPLPGPVVGFVLAAALATIAFLAIGLVVASVAPTAKIATGLGLATFFPLMFTGGLWLPRDAMPDVLRTISDATPTGATAQALQDATSGAWPSALALGVLALWAVGSGLLAARLFRWE